MNNLNARDRQLPVWLVVISIALPLTVGLLYLVPKTESVASVVLLIPGFNAIVNSSTIALLLAGYVAIRTGNVNTHKTLMLMAVTMSAMFLVGYVVYHSQVPSTRYEGEGLVRMIYFTLLITHIVLAAVIVPLILVTLLRALRGDFVLHKRIARYAYPAWLYVAVTGVIVYFMIEPYY